MTTIHPPMLAPATRSPSRLVASATLVSLTLLPVALVGIAAWMHRSNDVALAAVRADIAALQASQEKSVAGITALIKKQGEATYYGADALASACLFTNMQVTCTVTNQLLIPAETCFQPKATAKKTATTFHALPLCFHHVAPHETQTLSTPWQEGALTDLCAHHDYNGDLNTDKCDFKTDSPPATDHIVHTPL